MKCVILAGGSGDALWPLSRKNYPKQFINIREGRSLFQEAVARNLPFCDDFYIITNEKYRYIVEGQVQAFQGLSYQLFLEEMGRQTAPAVAVAAMCIDKEEDVLVVSTDHLIDDGDYNGTILAAKELLTDDNVVVVGCNRQQVMKNGMIKGHSAFGCIGNNVVEFFSQYDASEVSALSDETAQLNSSALSNEAARSHASVLSYEAAQSEESALKEEEILLDSGIFMMKAGVYLSAIKENAPELYKKCQLGTDRVRLDGNAFLITGRWLSSIPSLSVGEVVFANWAGKKVKAVRAQFSWSRLLNTEMVTQYDAPSLQGPSIIENSSNVSVLNETKDKLVVVNGCDDLLVVNAKDATYISRKGDSQAVREIMNKHYAEQKDIFDEGDVFYTTWGIKETLNRTDGYMVRKVTVFPGKEIALHKHEKRSEHCSIVSGNATITMDGITREYGCEDNVFIPVGCFHCIKNIFAKDLVFIEVSVGDSAGQKTGDMVRAMDDFVKLGPAYKDYLWGGTRLYEKYGKKNKDNKEHIIAESWEVSAHSAGPSIVTEGNAKGMTFPQYLEKIGKEAWGWKCKPFDRFPLLIKLIDATKSLSVQVHPDDEYAMSVEGEYGKNEMWYVMDAAKDSGLYVGFKEEITAKQCRERIEKGTLTDVLQRIPVKKGDVIFVKAGTVHAILEGLLILEIQQSSNATYRLYDYDRVDKNGNKRELHLEKALDNLNFSVMPCDCKPAGEAEKGKGYTKQLLGECKYFSATLYTVEKEAEISLDETSFSAIVFLEGKGMIQTEKQKSRFKAGDSYFVPAGKKVLAIDGACQFVLSRI